MLYRMRPALPFRDSRLLAGLVLILAWLLWPAAALRAEQEPVTALPPAVDLGADATLQRQRNLPLLVLYTRDDCSWCELLRRDFLGPMQQDPAAPVLIRQINIDRDTPLLDWRGQRTTHREFAQQRQIKFTPVIAFLGPSGEMLAEPIVGVPNIDFYSVLLERGIAAASRHLHGEVRP